MSIGVGSGDGGGDNAKGNDKLYVGSFVLIATYIVVVLVMILMALDWLPCQILSASTDPLLLFTIATRLASRSTGSLFSMN